ncbi:MAG: hypothetical protein ABEH88_00885 [Halobacteriales archaeon]
MTSPPGIEANGSVNGSAIREAHYSILNGSSFQVNVSVEGGENPIAFTLSNGTSAARIEIRELDGDGVARFYVSPDYVTRFNNTQSPPKTYSYGSTGTQFRVAFTYAILLRAYPSQQLNLGTFEENGTVTRNGEELTRLSATGINQTAVEESGAFSNANLTDMSGEVLVRSDGLVREMNLQQSFADGQTQNLSFSLTGLGSTSADAPGWIGEAPRLEGSLSDDGTVMELAHTGGPEIPAGANLTLRSGGFGVGLATANVTLPESVSPGDSVYVHATGEASNPTVEVSVNDPPSPTDALNLSQYSPQVSGTLGEVRFVIGVPEDDEGDEQEGPTLRSAGGSVDPSVVNESVTESHDVSAVFENVSRDGNTDTFAMTFPDAVAGENLSANSATVTDRLDGSEISISSSVSKVDGPDQDGVMDTLTFAVSPDGAGTVDVVANVSVDITWPPVDADRIYTIRASAADSATGNVSLTPVASATVVDTDADPEPRATEVNLVPAEEEVSQGQATTYEVVVANASGGVGAHNTTVTLENSSVAAITGVSLRGNPGQQSVEIASDNSSVTIEAALMDTNDTGSVTVATVTVEGTNRGTTGVNLAVDSAGTETRSDYTVTGVGDASLQVTLSPVGGFDAPPTDPDGDGLYEDINGNGEANVVDVQAMFANRDDSVLTENLQLFDFSGNGEVDVVDVQALFAELTS